MPTIKVKRSATAGAAPASLAAGELAVNSTDRRLWVGHTDGTPHEIAGRNPASALHAILSGFGGNYGRNPRTRGTVASPPTITVGTSALPSGYTRTWTFGDAGHPFRSYGGKPVTVSGATSFPSVTTGGTTVIGRHWRVETLVDGDGVAFLVDSDATSGGGYRFLVDGQYVSLSGTTTATGSARYITLAFSSVAVRRVAIEGYGNLKFNGAATKDNGNLWTPELVKQPRIMFVGDSNQEAYGITLKGDSPVATVGDYLGCWDSWNLGVYGTGFKANNGGSGYTYAGRRADWQNNAPDLLVFYSSVNDRTGGYTPASVATAAAAEVAAVRAAFGPEFPVLIYGMEAAEDSSLNPSADVAQDTAIASAIAALNDPYALFVPTITSGRTQVITGTGPGHGTFDRYVNTSTGHASVAGNWAFGAQDSMRIAEALSSMAGMYATRPQPA